MFPHVQFPEMKEYKHEKRPVVLDPISSILDKVWATLNSMMLFSSLTSLIKNQIQTSSQLVILWPSRSSSTKRKWPSTRKSLKSWSRTVFPSSISWLCRSSWRESKSHKEGLQDLDYSQLGLRRGRWMPYELLQTNGWSDTSIFFSYFYDALGCCHSWQRRQVPRLWFCRIRKRKGF